MKRGFNNPGESQLANPSFLRWAGSKRRLIPILQTYWTGDYKRYLEPFAGSARLFFFLRPKRAILGDLNGDLIWTYQEIKYRPNDVVRQLRGLRSGKREYLRLRSTDPDRLGAAARAARFIFLNRYCFNGLYRTNQKGEFNVPYSGQKTGSLPSSEILGECSKRLRVARLIRGDFEKVLEKAEPGDFVYMDPPFAVRGRRVFNEYDPSTFSNADVFRLRQWMDKLSARRISFVVSYAESEEAEILQKGFRYRTIAVKRNIAGFAAHRRDSNEILISNV